MPLTVAVTGPTGDIGRPLLGLLEHTDEVETVRGMARRPIDPAAEGWSKVEYRQGDILDPEAVADLVAGADVVVHLAFIIFGDHEESRGVNLEGTRNVFDAAVAAGAKRLVYTSSVSAYGFHLDNPQPLTEDIDPLGTDNFYYSAQKAELEGLVEEIFSGAETDAYVFRPCIVAGPEAITILEQVVSQVDLGGRLAPVRRAAESLPFLRPILPDPGVPIQLVHHDDVAAALELAILGRGEPGVYNLAGDGEISVSAIASALGWYSVPVPDLAVRVAAELVDRVPFRPAELEWVHAGRAPVLMDSTKARRDLGWEARWDAAETLRLTVEAAREARVLT